MDFKRFRTHGDAPTRAFEGFAGLLFERWCQAKFGAQAKETVFVNGAGGDGGVEAYTRLEDGTIIGLQAKWFDGPVDANRINQIRKSLASAKAARPGLTTYVVAINSDLTDFGENKPEKTAQHERWASFVKEHPDIRFELWDETTLTSVMATLSEEGFRRYWFEDTEITQTNLAFYYRQTLHGWLRNRYEPNLHQAGQISSDLRVRLSPPSVQQGWLRELHASRHALEQVIRTLGRLRRLPDIYARPDVPELTSAAVAWCQTALAQVDQIEAIIHSSPGFPIPISDGEDLAIPESVVSLAEFLERIDDDGWRTSPVASIRRDVDRCLAQWRQRTVTFAMLRDYGKPVVYVGEPGSGKTHALAQAVQAHLAQGFPAVLIRAKDIPPDADWRQILGVATGETTWTLPDMCDALEATAVHAGVRLAATLPAGEPAPAPHALIAVDGLDESVPFDVWAGRLGALIPVLERWPHLRFVFSIRPSHLGRLEATDAFKIVHIGASDPPLHQVFSAHCRANDIICPPQIHWALRTPAAIRLFAERYAHQTLTDYAYHDFSIDRLINAKLAELERQIRARHPNPWPETFHAVRAVLVGVAKSYVDASAPVTTAAAVAEISARLPAPNLLSAGDIIRLLELCRDSGLLLHTHSRPENPWDIPEDRWEPATQVITDNLLAQIAARSLQHPGADHTQLPPFLRYRPDATAYAVTMLVSGGRNFVDEGIWSADLDPETCARLQLEALVSAPPAIAAQYIPWVTDLFTTNMPNCRSVLSNLVIPSLRLRAHPFGAQFVAKILAPLPVAQRDLFWSGPIDLGGDSGAPWEGYGEPALEEDLNIAPDDHWHMAPLLAAWAFTSVNTENRARLRRELAPWAATNPQQFLDLLQDTVATNDPQMKEELFITAFGAVCLAQSMADWQPLCIWLQDGYVNGANPHLQTSNAAVRLCIERILHRCALCGLLAMDTPTHAQMRQEDPNPSSVAEPYLPFDCQPAVNADPEYGYGPVRSDLIWYVVPHAIGPFFDPHHPIVQVADQATAPASDPLDAVSTPILTAATSRRIRLNIADAQLSEIKRHLNVRLAERDALQFARESAMAELVSRSGAETDKADDTSTVAVPVAAFTEAIRRDPPEDDALKAAKEFLAMYARHCSTEELGRSQFAVGYLMAYLRELGWNEETFSGSPNPDDPQEIVGADIAIIYKHAPARQGQRSPVASYVEKYIWCGVHELVGYLAAHIPASSNGQIFEPPVPLHLVVDDLPNPADDIIGQDISPSAPALCFVAAPDCPLESDSQVDRANAWIIKAPLPDLNPLFLPPTVDFLPDIPPDSLILLGTVVVITHEDSQADSHIEVSSFLVPRSVTDILCEDAGAGICIARQDFSAHVDTAQSPLLAAWTDGEEEQELTQPYWTVNELGQPHRVQLVATQCRYIYRNQSSEIVTYGPSAPIRQALHITGFANGIYTDSQGDAVAYSVRMKASSTPTHIHQAVYVRRDMLEAWLQEEGLALCWAGQIYRQPAPPLFQSGWPRTTSNTSVFAWYDTRDPVNVLYGLSDRKSFIVEKA